MSNADDAEAYLSPAVRQEIDDRLSDYYGGYIDKRSFSEIGAGLAEALEGDGSLPEEVMLVVRRNGFGPFGRGVSYQLAVEAIDIASGRSGMGFA